MNSRISPPENHQVWNILAGHEELAATELGQLECHRSRKRGQGEVCAGRQVACTTSHTGSLLRRICHRAWILATYRDAKDGRLVQDAASAWLTLLCLSERRCAW